MSAVAIAGRTHLDCRSSLKLGRDELILNKELLAILYSIKLIQALEGVYLAYICGDNPLKINYSILRLWPLIFYPARIYS